MDCRLDRAKQKAIRTYHETKTQDAAIFLTLTYSDEHVGDGRLNYRDFQLFMKKLRKETDGKLGYMVTGEYGGPPKTLPGGRISEGWRPHWHAIIFGYYPADARKDRETKRGDIVYVSNRIDQIWEKGRAEFGSVTLESANYVARYAAKKLIHGPDKSHDFHPIHRTSKTHALGKAWIEKYWKSTFEKGYVILEGGTKAPIPRYYQDWLKKNHFDDWVTYMFTVKQETIREAQAKVNADNLAYQIYLENRRHDFELYMNRIEEPAKLRARVTQIKFNQLQERLKL